MSFGPVTIFSLVCYSNFDKGPDCQKLPPRRLDSENAFDSRDSELRSDQNLMFRNHAGSGSGFLPPLPTLAQVCREEGVYRGGKDYSLSRECIRRMTLATTNL